MLEAISLTMRRSAKEWRDVVRTPSSSYSVGGCSSSSPSSSNASLFCTCVYSRVGQPGLCISSMTSCMRDGEVGTSSCHEQHRTGRMLTIQPTFYVYQLASSPRQYAGEAFSARRCLQYVSGGANSGRTCPPRCMVLFWVQGSTATLCSAVSTLRMRPLRHSETCTSRGPPLLHGHADLDQAVPVYLHEAGLRRTRSPKRTTFPAIEPWTHGALSGQEAPRLWVHGKVQHAQRW